MWFSLHWPNNFKTRIVSKINENMRKLLRYCITDISFRCLIREFVISRKGINPASDTWNSLGPSSRRVIIIETFSIDGSFWKRMEWCCGDPTTVVVTISWWACFPWILDFSYAHVKFVTSASFWKRTSSYAWIGPMGYKIYLKKYLKLSTIKLLFKSPFVLSSLTIAC